MMTVTDSPFDSDHYGIKIGRLVVDDERDLDLETALAAGRAAGHAVLFARLPERHPVTARLAERGIAPLETLVTLALENRAEVTVASPVSIEHVDMVVEPEVVDAIAALTGEAIERTHLHADPRLPPERTRALYTAWARNDVTGRAQKTFLARDGQTIIGYITVLIRDEIAVIDLVAVKPEWQGRGIGAALLAAFLDWLSGTELGATVGTQSHNRALKLYQRFGFLPKHAHSTFHIWLDA